MWKNRAVSFLRVSFLGLMLQAVSSQAIFAERITLRICSYEGYVEPFVENYKTRAKEKFQADVDFAITHIIKPNDAYLAALHQSADLVTITHNLYKSESSPFLDKGLLSPIDFKPIENYRHVLPVFVKKEFVGINGDLYGIPLAVGFYALAYNTEKVSEAPTSWNVLWDDAYANSYSISSDYYECNIYITALALGVPPESLYEAQNIFEKIPIRDLRDKLNRLAKNAYSLWLDEASVEEMKNLSLITTWGYPVIEANQEGQKWKFVFPKEGLTAWIDNWSITKAVEPESLKYKICLDWIDYSLSPGVQERAIQEWGNTPVVGNIKDRFSLEEVDAFKVGNSDYWEKVSFWGVLRKESIRVEQALWRYALAQRHSRDRMQDYMNVLKQNGESERNDSLGLGENTAMGSNSDRPSTKSVPDRTDISIALSDYLLQRIRVMSIKKRSTIDVLIEEAIREYLERNEEIPSLKKK